MLGNISHSLFRPVLVARVLFVLLTTWCGLMLAERTTITFLGFQIPQSILYSLVAFLIALVITIVEHATDAISSHKLLMAALGMMAGMLFAQLFYPTIPTTPDNTEKVRMACNLFFGYFGIILAIKHAERFHPRRLGFLFSQQAAVPKVLDSSVIIDGRIRELVSLQVVKGAILAPSFVLTEIQAIADATDPNRKARGRRGLDVLGGLREDCKSLEVIDKDFPDVQGVDQKLVHLCREMQADLITNDFNLQKIAQLHGITVININEMANALKPTVYIGETFPITIVREGKEAGQGVGYLEDGTMVVVDDANAYLNQEIDVIVSSILQTSSGRMIFARLREEDRPRVDQRQRVRA